MSMDDKSEDGESACPFCGSSGDCNHHLLVVDKSFRTAEVGALMHAFNARWSALIEDAADDFDEREAFDKLLVEVNALSDAEIECDHEGGPGMSSSHATYFTKSKAGAKNILARFSERSN